MKVRDLIHRLEKLDPDMFVVLMKDAEGNGYSQYVNINTGHYLFGDREEVHPDDLSDFPEAEKVVFIYPS